MKTGIKLKTPSSYPNVYYLGLFELTSDWKMHQYNMTQVGCCLLPYTVGTTYQTFRTLQGKRFGEALIIRLKDEI